MSNVCCQLAWCSSPMMNKLRGMQSIWKDVIKTYFNIYFWPNHLMPRGSKHGFTHHNLVCNLSHFQIIPYLLIFDNGCLDLRMKGILKHYFNCFIWCTYPENMGLDTKIASLFKLYHIYWFPIMAASSHLGFGNEGEVETLL